MTALSDLNFESGIARLTRRQEALWGFRSGDRGTHTSRTIMLNDLSHLLNAVPREANRGDYVEAVITHNCLGKRTAATRKISLQRLTELYALRRDVILFHVLRILWERDEASRPLLALLMTLARDPLLRVTATAIVCTPYGHEFAGQHRQSMRDALAEAAGDRLNEATMDKVVCRASSSWTQSGHLRGRVRKTRQKVGATPAATAFALLLGFAVGQRGPLLLEAPWVAVLNASPDTLMDLSADAKRLGLLDFKQSGSMIDVSFPTLLARKERELIQGTYRPMRKSGS